VKAARLTVGMARVEDDATGNHQVYVDRLPVGGFNGRIYLSPIGAKPPDPTPERPTETPTGTTDDEEEI